MKYDQLWRRPLDAAEEFDVTVARRVAAGVTNAINVSSLEDYWKQWRRASPDRCSDLRIVGARRDGGAEHPLVAYRHLVTPLAE
jgi:hypothetical protein